MSERPSRKSWEKSRFQQANRVMSHLVRYQKTQTYIQNRQKSADQAAREAAQYRQWLAKESDPQKKPGLAALLEDAEYQQQFFVMCSVTAHKRSKRDWEEAWRICREHNLHFDAIWAEAKQAASKKLDTPHRSSTQVRRDQSAKYQKWLDRQRAKGKIPPVE